MSNLKATKRAFLSGIIAIVLCISMFVGTTFAWFTDTASTAVNKIQAGTLDVELQMWNGNAYEDISTNPKPIFGTGSIAQNNNAQTVWEPGKTQVAYLAIVNKGDLALKYQVGLNVTNPEGGKNLYEVMQYAITPDAQPTVESAVTSWDSANAKSVTPGQKIVSEADVPMSVGATHYFALSVHMNETAGNTYQGGKVNFDLTVYATQLSSESDSFGTDYDASAEYPLNIVANVEVTNDNKVASAATVESAAKVAGSDNKPVAKVVIPEGAAVLAGTTQLTLTIEEADEPSNFTVAAGLDAQTFEVDVEGLDKDNNTELFKVEMFVGTGLTSFKLYHNGTAMTKKDAETSVIANQDYYYDSTAGVVTFLTKTFSPFTSTYDKESWANHAAENYATPVDTTAKTVTIASAEELALFAKEVNGGTTYNGYTINLTADIDLSAYKWVPIMNGGVNWAGLSGATIDGNGYTISNMVAYHDTTSGFIGASASAMTIKDITFDNATVSTKPNQGQSYAGVIMGKNYSPLTIENVNVKNSVVKNNWQCGGLVGFAEGNGPKFKNCNVENSYFGGYNATAGTFFGLGIVEITLENCTAKNVQLYTDSLTWNSTAKQVGNFYVGHLYGKTLTTDNCTETNVMVVSE